MDNVTVSDLIKLLDKEGIGVVVLLEKRGSYLYRLMENFLDTSHLQSLMDTETDLLQMFV